MFKSKLKALDHPNPELINIDDAKQFRATVLWLEDQKIRHYKIEDRANMRDNIENPDKWNKAYEAYKKDLNIPGYLKSPQEELAWIITYATRLEYYDKVDKYSPITSEKVLEDRQKISNAPSIKSTNPFDNLDFSSEESIAAIRSLANKLDIPYHPDHLTQLRAISALVKNHLSTEALKEPLLKNTDQSLEEMVLGKDYDKDNLEFATRILRLLQIQSIRKLQTTINETIVAVQNITADPKTDTKLGKVGF